MKKFEQLIKYGAENIFSDIHIGGGSKTVFRQHGINHSNNQFVWSHKELDALVGQLLDEYQKDTLLTRHSVDLSRTVQKVRLRMHIFHAMTGFSISIRLLPGKVHSIEGVNLHPSLKNFCKPGPGLILVCGASGSGKTTTIAAIIEEINRNHSANIVTLEDPVEYIFNSKKSLIVQRELGIQIPSYKQGLIDIMREDLDVVMVGELRTAEEMTLALHAAESGHLVIASLHASTPEEAIYRICNSATAELQEMIRHQLAVALKLLITQEFYFLKDFGFRVPMLSIMVNTQSTRGIIRDNNLSQIESTLQTSRDDGMYSIDQYRSYLDNRKDYSPPSVVFKPSSEDESGAALFHTPTLFLSRQKGAEIKKTEDKRVSHHEKKIQKEDKSIDELSPHYVINEDTRLDEIIKEIKK
ncbi:MAG: Flp pilus assembly complex ATPase component TadA [Proteobacteria bacterium]|nr:Flp pilus assembly complex ATPase component TadA [Pseudomonadota bacterium]